MQHVTKDFFHRYGFVLLPQHPTFLYWPFESFPARNNSSSSYTLKSTTSKKIILEFLQFPLINRRSYVDIRLSSKLEKIFLEISLSQWYGHLRVLGIPISKTLVIWASPVTLTITQIAKVIWEGDAHITRVLDMGMPETREQGVSLSLGFSRQNIEPVAWWPAACQHFRCAS